MQLCLRRERKLKTAFVGDPHLTENIPRCRKDNFLDSMLIKLDRICEENDVIVILGDLFHKPGVSLYTVSRTMEVLGKHRRLGKRILACTGNHDVYNMNVSEEMMKKVALQLLANAGVIELPPTAVFDHMVIDFFPLERVASNLAVEGVNSDLTVEGKTYIGVGHYYFESDRDKRFSLVGQQLEKWNYDFVVLGHDHEFHEPLQFGKCWLMRPGSISRGTSHQHNLFRTPEYLQIEVGPDHPPVLRMVECEALPPSEVFYEPAKPKNKELDTVIDNLEELFSVFKQNTTKGKYSVAGILETLEAPSPVVGLLRDIHEELGLSF